MEIILKLSRTFTFALLLCATCVAHGEQTRHFIAEYSVEVNGQPYRADFAYHCDYELTGPNFGPGGILIRVWKPEPIIPWLVLRLPGEAAILRKTSQPCEDQKAGNFGGPLIVDSLRNPTSIESFEYGRTRGKDYIVKGDGMEVHSRLAGPDTEPNHEDVEIWKSLFKTGRRFQTVQAVFVEEAQLPDRIKEFLGQLQEFAIATDSDPLRRRIFPIGDVRNGHPELYYGRPRIPLLYDGSAWSPSSAKPTEAAQHFRVLPAESGKSAFDVPPVLVRYGAKSIPVDRAQEVFDPGTRTLVQFHNFLRPGF